MIIGCTKSGDGKKDVVTIIFKHGKIAGDPDPFNRLIKRFEQDNPGIKVKDQTGGY